MKPVMQTRYGYPDGNCFAACIASILELELDQVPVISSADDDHWTRWQAWLRERGLMMITWPLHDPEGNLMWTPWGYGLLACTPPGADRGDAPEDRSVGHSVVVYEGEVVHDPHPFDDLGEWTEWTAFVTLDPSRVDRPSQDALAAALSRRHGEPHERIEQDYETHNINAIVHRDPCEPKHHAAEAERILAAW